MDVLTRMKIEERLEFLPQTGKEEACICFPYLEDGVMKNMKFRDAAKHFKMVKGAELIPWNIDAIKGKEKCYITEGEIDACNLQTFLCLFLEKLNMPQNTPVTKAS